MFHSLSKTISAVTLLLATSSPHAAIMTFNSAQIVPDPDHFYPHYKEDGSHYQEDGITSSATSMDFHIPGGNKSLYFNDFGAMGQYSASFRMDSLFSAVSFDIPHRNSRLDENSYITDLVKAEGFLNGNLVASTTFPKEGPTTLLLPTTFTGLDNLTISVVDYSHRYASRSYNSPTACYNPPCNDFYIDNIILDPIAATPPSIAPVPLPAAFPLMTSALVCLSLFRRKKIK